MEVDDDIRRKAVAAVLDGGMTQVSVCRQYGLKAHVLRAWIVDERRRRANTASESPEARLQRLIREWGNDPTTFGRLIEQGQQKAKITNIWFDYVLGGTLVLAALLLSLGIVVLGGLLIADLFIRSPSWQSAVGPTLLILALGGASIYAAFAVAIYFSGLIYRVCAPFAYTVSNLQYAWDQLELHGAQVFDVAASREQKAACKQITKALGRAAHVLDVTRRRGRTHGYRITKDGERTARRNVAASVGGAEDLLYHQGVRAHGQAVEIFQIAVYATVLRRWALHDLKHLADQMPPSIWQRRIKPALKGTGAFATMMAPVTLEVLGAEGRTPGHFIRLILQSRGWLP